MLKKIDGVTFYIKDSFIADYSNEGAPDSYVSDEDKERQASAVGILMIVVAIVAFGLVGGVLAAKFGYLAL